MPFGSVDRPIPGGKIHTHTNTTTTTTKHTQIANSQDDICQLGVLTSTVLRLTKKCKCRLSRIICWSPSAAYFGISFLNKLVISVDFDSLVELMTHKLTLSSNWNAKMSRLSTFSNCALM